MVETGEQLDSVTPCLNLVAKVAKELKIGVQHLEPVYPRIPPDGTIST